MASANVYRGIGTRVNVAGALLDHDQISIDMATDDIPAVGFEDVAADGFTYDDGAMGVVGHTLAGSGYWDAALNPHSNPPRLTPCFYTGPVAVYLNKPPGSSTGANSAYPGTVTTNANPAPTQQASRSYQYTLIRVLSGRTTSQIRGRIDFNYTAKSCGLCIYPV